MRTMTTLWAAPVCLLFGRWGEHNTPSTGMALGHSSLDVCVCVCVSMVGAVCLGLGRDGQHAALPRVVAAVLAQVFDSVVSLNTCVTEDVHVSRSVQTRPESRRHFPDEALGESSGSPTGPDPGHSVLYVTQTRAIIDRHVRGTLSGGPISDPKRGKSPACDCTAVALCRSVHPGSLIFCKACRNCPQRLLAPAGFR